MVHTSEIFGVVGAVFYRGWVPSCHPCNSVKVEW